MDLATFLNLHDADIGVLIDGARSVVGLDDGGQLVAVGSLAEALGNRKSDVDLWYITHDPRYAGASPDEVRSFAAGQCVVDLRIVPASYVSALQTRLAQWARGGWNLTVAADFLAAELLSLHRLNTAVALWVAGAGANPTPDPNVARLKLHVARHMARTVQVDMAGYREVGDGQSLVFASQHLLDHAVDGLLAGFGMTNPTPKWRSRLLDRLPDDWESQLVRRPSGRGASELYWQLHRAPVEPVLAAAIAHGCRIATFARAAFLLAEERLVHTGVGLRPPLDWSIGPTPVDDPPLPLIDLDIDFWRMPDGVAIARLNAFGDTLHMSFEEFAVVLLFDERTTAHGAARAVAAAQADPMRDRLAQFARAVSCSSFVATA